MIPFVEPKQGVGAFNCPHCSAFAKQNWTAMQYYADGWQPIDNLTLAFCSSCGKFSLWYYSIMLYPDSSPIYPPNTDMQKEIQNDYNEARSIVNKSPRGASALLRLTLQKLVMQLGGNGENLNDDISKLVKIGLPGKIQKSLDIVRVIGNNAVHPGQIDLKDDIATASKLFELINIIAEVMITQPKKIDEIYNEKIPNEQKEAIKKRDK